MYFLRPIFTLLFFLSIHNCVSQGQLVMDNDGYIVITNGAYLVIGNSNANGITQTGTGGRIISEGEGNKVRWMVSNATGTYIIPFYENGEAVEIPLTVQITGAGTAGATNRIDFSTYDGNSDNATYMPSGVTNMGNVTVPTANNSAQVTDRFWVIDANHATKPSVTMSFTYVDAENAAPNTLSEANLRAQRWNTTTADWDGFLFPPIGSANTATNIVSGVITPSADFFGAWTLVDFATPLPIELLNNTILCNENNNVVMNWSTATETNNDFFTVEKSLDGINFIAIGTVNGAGNNTTIQNYSFIDHNSTNGISYYRLKQTDYNGNSKTYSILISQGCQSLSNNSIDAFNNQTGNIAILIEANQANEYTAALYDAIGKKIVSKGIKAEQGSNYHTMDISQVNAGVYFICIENESERITKKIMILK